MLRCNRALPSIAFVLSLFAAVTGTVDAAQRTFVSTAGNDANACSLSAPCRGFAKAITVTDPGGEIVVLDSGGYGAVSINKDVSINSPAGVYAGISVFATFDGITVRTPAAKVVLRGLTINGQGGNNGIRVQAGEVHVESTVISNLAQAGILVEGGSTVRVSGVVARSNADGLRVRPGTGAVSVLVRDSEFSNNTMAGVGVSPGAAGASALVTVERSSATKNGAGLVAAPTGSATATLVVTQSVASENAGAGVSSTGAGATVFVRESAITRNNVGLQQASSGLLNACGANLLVANATAESGAIITASCLDVAAASGTVKSVDTGSGLTGGPITTSGTINLAGTQLLPTSACTSGQVPRWSGSAWTCTTIGSGTITGVTASVPLTSSGGSAPNISLTGSVQVSNGGTGQTTLASNGVLIGQGTGGVSAAVGTTGQVFAGTAGAPGWTASPSISGNITLVKSTASAGNIMKGASPFVHNYGNQNTFIGENAGNFTMTGGGNTASGYNTLDQNTTGGENTASGSLALSSNTTGNSNTAIGYIALFTNITGTGNSASGAQALLTNSTGNNNTAYGNAALQSNTAADNNTAIGAVALNANTTGARNVASGAQALFSNTTGNGNTATGYQALYTNTTLGGNAAFGEYALYSNTTCCNTAIGEQALYSNTTGVNNTASGDYALFGNVVGSNNTANGAMALLNSTGSNNTATGTNALYDNAGDNNTATGANALQYNTTGAYNTASGANANFKNTTGSDNTSSGYEALWVNTTGTDNTALGYNALVNNTSGSDNVAIGSVAGQNLTTGDYNIDILNRGVAGDAHTIRIGDAHQVKTFIAGIRGITTGSGNAVAVIIDSNGQLGTVNSSRRYKDDIADMHDASSALMRLRPVTFYYKADHDPAGRTLQYGLVAEEVAQVAPELVAHKADGETETVYYQFLAPMLLNEYQKQQRTIEAQATEIVLLKQDRQSQTARIEALERHATEIEVLKQQVEQMTQLQVLAGRLTALSPRRGGQ